VSIREHSIGEDRVGIYRDNRENDREDSDALGGESSPLFFFFLIHVAREGVEEMIDDVSCEHLYAHLTRVS
jgi:hypothetical protein